MKKIIFILLLSVVCLQAQQDELRHFYVHGYGNDIGSRGSEMTEHLGQFVNLKIDDFDYDGFHSDWNSLSLYGLSSKADDLHATLTTIGKNWVGIGYSAGGLIARSVTHKQGLCPDPKTQDVMYDAYITIGTPNLGAPIANANNISYWVTKGAKARGKIARGHGGFLQTITNFVGDILEPATRFVSLVLTGIVSYANGATRDMKPGSGFLADINGFTPNSVKQDYELSLYRGRGAVWGNYGKWKYAGRSGDQKGSDAYQARYDYAKNRQQWNSRTARGKAWWQWHQASWLRGRSKDWRIAKEGYVALEDAWNYATAYRAASDGFIPWWSQKNIFVLDPNQFKQYVEPIHGHNSYSQSSHGTMLHREWIDGNHSRFAVVRVLENMGYE